MKDISQDIIDRAIEGDINAFEFIYRQCAGFVHNVALRVVHTRDDAEEVTQEVFIAVHRNLKKFRFDASFKTWIYRITINTAINCSKKWGRSRKREISFDESATSIASTATADEAADRKERDAQVNQMLAQLNDDQKQCLILRSVEGLSYQEIADVLRININTVRTRIKRARLKLVKLKKEVMGNEL